MGKSHFVKPFHQSNIDILSNVEKQLQFRDVLGSLYPSVRPFPRRELSVVICAMKFILNLTSYDKSASSTTQPHLFHFFYNERKKCSILSFINRDDLLNLDIQLLLF